MNSSSNLLAKTLIILFIFVAAFDSAKAQMVNTFPHQESFESFLPCGTSCGDSCYLYNGWVNVTIDNIDWAVDAGGTTTSGTGPDADHTSGTPAGKYLYIETSGSACYSATAAVETPPIDLSTITNFYMDFWYHMYGINVDTASIHVDVYSYRTSTYTDDIIPRIRTNLNAWQKQTVALNSFVGDTIKIRVRGRTGDGSSSDLALDDFKFYTLYNNDAGIVSVDSPFTPLAAGVHNVAVTLKNYAIDTLHSANIEWSVNGIVQSPFAWSGAVATNKTQGPVTIGNYNFTGGLYSIKVWTANPNGNTDGDLTNDTLEFSVCTALSGTYTIGGSTPDFTSFNDAASRLASCGISGPVVLNAAPGSTYHEQVIFTAVNGASATNTITINGNGDTLTFGANSTDRYIVRFDGAQHFIINNLVIVSTDQSYGWGIHLYNGADSNTISNCLIDVSTTTTSSSTVGIVASASTTSVTSQGYNCNYSTFSNNTIIGGYYSIVMEGSSLGKAMNIQLLNNTVKDFYSYGIYLNSHDGALVSGNDISRANRTSTGTFYGIYCTSISQNLKIDGNRIHNTHDASSSLTGLTYGIDFSGNDAPFGQENWVTNNIIYNINSNGTIYAIYNTSSDGAYYYHNTISLDFTASSGNTTRGFYQTSLATDVEFKNNIITMLRGGTGTKHCVYLGTNTSSIAMDNNVYFTDTSENFIGSFGTSGSVTLADWQGANGRIFDQHSVFEDPMYISPATGNFTPTNGAINNIGDTVNVATDFYGNARNINSPDPGAVEFVPPALDAAISWIAPVSPASIGTQTITVNIANGVGSISNITSLSLTYTDGFTPVTETFNTVNIAPGSNQNLSFTTTYNLIGIANFVAYINAVNGSPDAIQVNDTTAVQTVCPALSGNYTINASAPDTGSNFSSFSSAINALANCGIQTPVVVTVVPGSGPYNEQIEIPAIPGANAVNTVTINGSGDTLIAQPTALKRTLVTLNGAKHINLNNLVIVGTDLDYGWGIFLTNEADSNMINNCTIDLSATGTSTNANNANGIIAGASPTTSATGGNSTNYTTISNTTVIGGYYGIRLSGTSTTRLYFNNLTNNVIRDFYSYGIYLGYNQGTMVSENDISRANRVTTNTFYGVYETGCVDVDVIGNRLHNTHDHSSVLSGATYGFYLSSNDALTGEENRFVNNLIYNFNSNGEIYGIYNSSSDGVFYYHNTIALDHVTAATTGATRGFYQTGTATNIEFKNNIITVRRGGTGTKHCLYFNAASSMISSNNNVLLMNSSGGFNNHVGYYGGNDFTTLADWKTANSAAYDQQSVESNPQYVNPAAGDFTPTSSSVNGVGTGVGVHEDINQNPRNSNFPDPGAYEFTPAGLDAAIAWVSPTGSVTPGMQTVTVNINNTQTIAINSVDLTYTNGTTSISESFDGLSIPVGGNMNLSFATPYSITGFSSLYAYIDSVNGILDNDQTNDTTPVQYVCPGLSGTFTIDKTSPATATNFTSFSDAITKLTICQIVGPVVVNVAPGTGPYNEQVVIPFIPGASAVNSVTFNGNGQTITASPSSSAKYIMLLDGAKHVTINNLNLIGTDGTYGIGVLFINKADSNTINGCTIDLTAVSSTTQANSTGIVTTGDNISTTTGGDNGNYLTITNNTIIGGYHGIRLNGISSTPSMNCLIANNTIRDFWSYGIYLDDCDGTQLIGNDINRESRTSVSTFYGIYLTTGVQNVNMERNRIHNTHGAASSLTGSVYGIYIGSDAPVGLENKIVNNLFYDFNNNGILYGIYNTGSDGVKIYHNTLSLNNAAATGGTAYGFFQTSTADNIDFRNNIVSIQRGGTGAMYCLYFNTTASNITSDHNVLFTDTSISNRYIGRYGTNNFSGISQWQTANSGAYDQNSVYINPVFADPTLGDFKPITDAFDDLGTPVGVIIDFNQSPRDPVTPDIGAIEFTPIAIDASVITLIEPTNFGCASNSIDVSVLIKNYGLDTLNNVPVTTVITGALSTTLTGVSGSINPVGVDTVFMGSFNLPVGGALTVTSFTSAPGDTDTYNDTLVSFVNLNPLPVQPTAQPYPDSVCLNIPVTIDLNAEPATTYFWYGAPAGGNLIHQGTSYTNPGNSSATYYVEARANSEYPLGEPDNNIGGTGSGYVNLSYGFYLDVYTTIIIDSVTVYPDGMGTVSLQLSNPANNFVYNSVSVPVNDTSGGKVRIPVGLTIDPGSYRLDNDGSTVNLFRNTDGASFPYEIPGVVSLTGNTFSGYPNYYYYFYDWKITALGCPSPRTALSVYINPVATPASASFNANTGNGLDVSFTATNPVIWNDYSWDFGDGSQGNTSTLNHAYPDDGTYTACLYVSNVCSDDSSCHTFTVCEDLSGDIDYQSSGDGLILNFSFAGTGTPTNYFWDFGGGNTATDPSPTFAYPSEGLYNVTLITENLCGDQDTITVSVSACQTLSATVSAVRDVSGLTFNFTGTTTGNVTSVLWDFGDGQTSNSTNPSHTYAGIGSYEVLLILTNLCGSDTTTTTIYACKDLDVTFDAIVQTDGYTIVTVNGSSGSGVTYSWNFGDGSTSTETNPTHHYTAPGTYSVEMTATDACGQSETFTKQVPIAVGIANINTLENSLALYPNPNNGSFNIDFELEKSGTIRIRILNVIGEEVFEETKDFTAAKHQLEFNLRNYSTGLYMVEFTMDKNIAIKKVVVE